MPATEVTTFSADQRLQNRYWPWLSALSEALIGARRECPSGLGS